jgi:hypothetical protein
MARTSVVGRFSPESTPSRASCKAPCAASPASPRCPRDRDEPTPASMPWARWPALSSKPAFPLKTWFALSTGLFPRPSASSKRERRQVPSTHGTRQSPRAMNTGSSGRPFAHPSWLGMYMLVAGQWTWNCCKCQPACLKANMIFSAFPQRFVRHGIRTGARQGARPGFRA